MTGIVIEAGAIFGLKALDDEHQATAAGIRKLESTLAPSAYRAGLTEAALGDLIDMIKTHFVNEEAWMREIEYPGFQAHRRQHEKLMAVLNEFLEEFKTKPTLDHGEKIHGLANDWLSHHTAHSDSVAGKYFLHRRCP